jgi:hypothetical protein
MDATRRALDMGRRGDIVVLCVDHANLAWRRSRTGCTARETAGRPGKRMAPGRRRSRRRTSSRRTDPGAPAHPGGRGAP